MQTTRANLQPTREGTPGKHNVAVMKTMDNTQETDYSSDCDDSGIHLKAGVLVESRIQQILNVGSLSLPSVPQASAELIKSASRLELEAVSLKAEIEVIMRKVMQSRDAENVKTTVTPLPPDPNSVTMDSKLQDLLALIIDIVSKLAMDILKMNATASEVKLLASNDQRLDNEERLNALVARSTINTTTCEVLIKNLLSIVEQLLTIVEKLGSKISAIEDNNILSFSKDLDAKISMINLRVSAVQQTISATMNSVDRTVSRMNEALSRMANSQTTHSVPPVDVRLSPLQDENLALVKECMTLVLPRILGIEHTVLHTCNILNSNCMAERTTVNPEQRRQASSPEPRYDKPAPKRKRLR